MTKIKIQPNHSKVKEQKEENSDKKIKFLEVEPEDDRNTQLNNDNKMQEIEEDKESDRPKQGFNFDALNFEDDDLDDIMFQGLGILKYI